MASWVWPVIAAFVVLDLIITVFVLRHVFRHAERMAGLDFVRLRPLAEAIHDRVGEYLQIHYDGSPEQLPALLVALMPELREIARQKNLDADDETLKAALLVAVSAHGLANPRQMRDALAKVA